jgi:glucose/mannose transport system substrate-binding protein
MLNLMKFGAKKLIALGLLCFAFGSVSACDASSDPPNTIEVINWWIKGGELPAFQAVVDRFHRMHTNQRVKNYALENSAKARDAIVRQMLRGEPPDTFQANGGWDLMDWVFHNHINDKGTKLEALDAPWKDKIPTPVLDTVRVGDNIYGVPVNIHRVNTLFFNAQVFESRKLLVPSKETLPTLEDLFTLLDTLRLNGVATPLALGTADSWPLALLLFENILVGHSDGEYYQAFFRGEETDVSSSPRVKRAVEDLGRLLSYDPVAGTRTWDEAIDEVRSGRAAITIMGDWANGYLRDKAKTDPMPVVFGQIATPGTDGTFVFTTDTFGLPSGALNPEGAKQLLQFFASPEAQDVFNPIKGSIPARDDAGNGAYDQMALETIKDFKAVSGDRTKLVPATAILAPPEYMKAVFDMLAYFAGNQPPDLPPKPELKGNVSVVLHGLQNWSDVLRKGPWHW